VAWIAERELGVAESVTRGEDGGIDVVLEVGAVPPLLSWLIGFEDRAVILEPAHLIDQFVELIRGGS
jgi:predicted DNA-binding transcriptional regulator YafY